MRRLTNDVTSQDLETRIHDAIAGTNMRTLKGLKVHVNPNEVVIEGRLPSFYLQQIIISTIGRLASQANRQLQMQVAIDQ